MRLSVPFGLLAAIAVTSCSRDESAPSQPGDVTADPLPVTVSSRPTIVIVDRPGDELHYRAICEAWNLRRLLVWDRHITIDTDDRSYIAGYPAGEVDPWGHAYRIVSSNTDVAVESDGPDLRTGTADDIRVDGDSLARLQPRPQLTAAPVPDVRQAPTSPWREALRRGQIEWLRDHLEWGRAHAAAVEWLLAQQREDGGWSPSDAAADDPHEVAATAAATIALASTGSSVRFGARRAGVRRATKWLIEQQRSDGWFCDPGAPDARLAHALATAAFAFVYSVSEHRPYREPAERAVVALGAFDDARPIEPLLMVFTVLAARAIEGESGGVRSSTIRLVATIGDDGSCSAEAGTFAFVGTDAGSRDLATASIVMACHGANALAASDARTAAVDERLRSMVARIERDGSLDAVSLWCGSSAAFAIGGDARAAFERFLTERIVGPTAAPGARAWFRFANGPKLLRNEIAETALVATALAAPWFRFGR